MLSDLADGLKPQLYSWSGEYLKDLCHFSCMVMKYFLEKEALKLQWFMKYYKQDIWKREYLSRYVIKVHNEDLRCADHLVRPVWIMKTLLRYDGQVARIRDKRQVCVYPILQSHQTSYITKFNLAIVTKDMRSIRTNNLDIEYPWRYIDYKCLFIQFFNHAPQVLLHKLTLRS
jgi:hypothetical protein